MSELILEFKNCIPEILCDDIIEKYNESATENISIFEIPKNNTDWNKIELLLYKQLLISINKYKNNILGFNTDKSNNVTILLSNDLYTKKFIIHKIKPCKENILFEPCNKSYNRYNLLNYIFFLDNENDGCEFEFYNMIIRSEKGKLILFPDDFDYKHKFKKSILKTRHIIYGQICYKNII